MEKNLQKQGMNSLVSTIQITTNTDLLKAKPISVQVKEHGFDRIAFEVKLWLTKCATMLDIGMSDLKLEVLSHDIIEKYGSDSLEDVRECLKKARQGNYSEDKNAITYGKINMEVITKWMGIHLEDKTRAREQAMSQQQSEEESSGDRLIDIIYHQKQKINNMVANEEPRELIDVEYQKLLQLEKDQRDRNEELRKALEEARNVMKAKSEDLQSIKLQRIQNKREIELEQWKIAVKDYSEANLKLLRSKVNDSEIEAIINFELKKREDGKSTFNQNKSA